MLNLRFDVPFFQRGKFPASVSNASQEIIVPNPWTGRANSAPFDQRMSSRACSNFSKLTFFLKKKTFLIAFYLILDVAVGGTNGWFPDGAGNKPWLNGALGAFILLLFGRRHTHTRPRHRPLYSIYADAMQTFAKAEDKWYKTWPESDEDRAMRMYVIPTVFEKIVC